MATNLQIVDVNFKPIDLNHKEKKKWINLISYQSLTTSTAPTSISNSNINFNIFYPSSSAALDANLSITMTFQVTLGGTTTGSYLYNPGQLALRDFPINTVMLQVPQVAVNSVPINTQPTQYLRELLLYKMKHSDRLKWSSYTVTTPDNCTSYDQYSGSINNPIGSQSNAITGIHTPAGGGAGAPVILSNTSTSAILQYTLTENIMVFPFNYRNEIDYAIFGGNNVTIQLNLANDLTAIIRKLPQSGGAFANITSSSVNITNCVINTTFYTLPLNIVSQIPSLLQYPYKSYKYFKTSLPSGILDGAAFNVTSQNIQLNSIPEHCYIFARSYANTQNDNKNLPSMLCPISNLSINWNNQSSYLSTCTRNQLYDIMLRNGLEGFSYLEAVGSPLETQNTSPTKTVRPVGVPMCVRFGVDLPLKSDLLETVGQTNNQQFQVTATFWNNSGSTITNGYLILLFEYDGVFTIDRDGTVSYSEAPLSIENVANAEHHQGDYFQITGYDQLRGGNFFNKIKHGFHKLGHLLKSDIGKAITSGAMDVASLAMPEYAKQIQTAKAFKTKHGYGLITKKDLHNL